MKIILSLRKHHYVARLSIFLITVALIAGMVSCGGVTRYTLTISTTEGGEVTTPGEGIFNYDEGTDVDLVAEAEVGYQFVNWTGDVDDIADVEDATTTITVNDSYSITANFEEIPKVRYNLIISSTVGGEVTAPGEGIFNYDEGTDVDLVAVADEGYQFVNWTGDVSTIADVNAASTTITMNGDYSITANFAVAICDWYDLDAIRDNLGGSYVLMNDLDSTTAGYAELASPTANGGKGWKPIGPFDPYYDRAGGFAGVFDGQGYEIRDLFINRPDEDYVGPFGGVDQGGVIENLGVANTDVTGNSHVGGLAGQNGGLVSNCYSSGSITGWWRVAGLVGYNEGGGTVSNSYVTSSVIGGMAIGGLVAVNLGTVSNSHYNYDEILINGENIITIGALFVQDFEQWLADDKSLDADERLVQQDGYYMINNVGDFKELLAFGQDSSLKFRLTNDLDLGSERNFYIPYLAGEFDGNGYEIRNLSFNFDSVSYVGSFGFLARDGKASEVGVENVSVSGFSAVGGLVGWNGGTVSNSYSTGGVIGRDEFVGGLVGENDGTVSNSYSTGSVTGSSNVGGLVGLNGGTVSNSYYNYDEALINGKSVITIGALSNEDFDQWLARDKLLDVNERLPQEDGYYLIDDVCDFKELLAFGQNGSLKFRLENDLDLETEANFYIPYLAGEFDGNGHKIWNLSFNFDFVSSVGLFGYLGSGGEVSEVRVKNVNVSGTRQVGGLVGGAAGTVSDSYSDGSVTGSFYVGGLVGLNGGSVGNSYSATSVSGGWNVGGLVGDSWGTVSNSYSTGSVTGGRAIGGLVGDNWGAVSNCYSTGSVTGDEHVGGLVGWNGGTASESFWNIETSGQATSDGGIGKTTAEMKNIATFSGAAWNIVAVAFGETNPAYTWNIVDGETYPFLSWQSVS